MFLENVHILFTRPHLSLPASGLRLETAFKIDKKKSELYFSFPVKKTLTEKSESTLPKNYKTTRLRAFGSAFAS